MRSRCQVLCYCTVFLGFFICEARPQELHNVGFGVIQSVNPQLSGEGMSAFSSIFLNYHLTNRVKIQLEHKSGSGFFSVSNNSEVTEPEVRTGWLKKDWSTKIFLQYYLQPSDAPITSYFGIGAGRYYIYDSKRKIKAEDASQSRDENLEYAMRKYFRKPGIIGALGLEFTPFATTTLFLRGQCSLLFEEQAIAEPATHFSDFINISMGIRLKLK